MDRKSMAILHSVFPSSNALTGFKSYQARISEPAGFLAGHGLNRVMLIQNMINLGGYQKVEANGEFILDVILDGIQYNENRTITNSSTDKSGKITNSYQFKISFYIPVTIRILDNSQKIISTKEIRNARHLSEWNSNAYGNRRDLDNYMEGNRKQVISSLVAKYIESAFNEISISLTKEFGFHEELEWVGFYELDSKSHPEYDNYKKNIEIMEKEFKSYKPGMNVSEARARMSPTIDYFTSLIPKLNKEEKHQYKLLKHTLINLIWLNLYLDDFEGYKKYNEKLATIEDKDYWEGKEVRETEHMYKNMIACGYKSLYAVRELSHSEGAKVISQPKEEEKPVAQEAKSSIQEIDLSRLKRNPTDRVVPGVYTGIDNSEVKGYYVIGPGDDDRFIFNGSLQNTFFVYMDEKGVAKTKPIQPKKLKSFSIDKHRFVMIEYKAPVMFASKAASIMEVLFEHPEFNLYKYYPEDGDSETADDYAYVFVKSSDQKSIAFSGNDMFWKKKAKEYFATCQSILDEIEKLKYVSPNKIIALSWAGLYADCFKQK